jgi:hypothetical protein
VIFGQAEPLPGLNALFEQKKGWIGGDGADSVALSSRQTLWLFCDTWVGTIREGKRCDATIVNNTLALQDGEGGGSQVDFIVRHDANGKPAALVTPQDGRGWFWLGAGTCVEGRLYFFLSQLERAGKPGVFDFHPIGRWLAMVSNPLDPPLSWRMEQIKMPCAIFTPQRELSFGASVVEDGAYLYVYGTDEDVTATSRERYLIVARVPSRTVKDFTTWRFYHDGQWETDFHSASRLVNHMDSEYSVTYLSQLRQYVLVYTENGLSARILARTAPTPCGPWSPSTLIYQCPEMGQDPRIFCYAAKAHPSLAHGNEMIVSYVANSFDFWQVAADARLYWPRFFKVSLSEKN